MLRVRVHESYIYAWTDKDSGHGYMMIAGIPEIVASSSAAPTFEGENYVLWQQVGRYLFKCLDNLAAGKTIDLRMAYLEEAFASFENGASPQNCSVQGDELLDHVVQISIYRHRALRLIVKAWTSVRSSPKPIADAWNDHMMAIISAARAHTEYVVVSYFVEAVMALPTSTSPALRQVLDALCCCSLLMLLCSHG